MKNILLSRLGLRNSERIHARKCKVVHPETKQAKKFYDENHIQGFNGRSSTAIGLEHEGHLVACMSFTKSFANRRKKAQDGEWELQRFATSASVPGAASRLFKHFQREHDMKVCTSYSDRRLFGGGTYTALGFVQDDEVPPDYEYVFLNPSRREHKSRWQKKKIKEKLPEVWSEGRTEKQMMEDAGIYQIYNEGLVRWVWCATI